MNSIQRYNYTPLKKPIPITEQHWPEDTLPIVHTRTMTFMHEKYIRECIEGILMQKTTFPVQVLIHDDASTDGTVDILREYEHKYPHLIKVFYQKENSYSKPDKYERRAEFRKWRIGKYEAMCEGDDYWTDPLKLQKQVDFLEANPHCSFCFHSSMIRYINRGIEYVVHDYGNSNKVFKSEDLFSGKINMWTASILVRTNIVTSIPNNLPQLKYGDVRLKFWAASKGCIGYIGGGYMSVYRRGVEGAWSENERKNFNWEVERLSEHYKIYHVFKEILPIKHQKYLKKYKTKHERIFYNSLHNYFQGYNLLLAYLKNIKYVNYNILVFLKRVCKNIILEI